VVDIEVVDGEAAISESGDGAKSQRRSCCHFSTAVMAAAGLLVLLVVGVAVAVPTVLVPRVAGGTLCGAH
jgi:hypothetical protein